MADPQSSQRRSRFALLTLLYWCSSSAEATSVLQHRVRPAQRQVPYHHTLERKPRGSFDKFRRTLSTGAYVENGNQNTQALELQDYEQGRFWIHSTTLPGESSNNAKQQSKQQRGFLRKLYDQFIGEDTSENPGNQTNVTTEVDFNSTNGNINSTGDSIVYTVSNETQNVTEFNPIRIRALLAEHSDFLTKDERESLFHEMLSPALLSWSSALRVDQVAGNLTVDPAQLLDGEICGPGNGLPSIQVPKEHIDEGIPDTDFIVYLSIGFTTPRNRTISHDLNATDANTTEYPALRRQLKKDKSEPTVTFDEGDEDEDEEVVVEHLVSIEESLSCNREHYLAAASFCSTDQYDRPTAALLHICVEETFFDQDKRVGNTMTLMHELGHALGFNSLSMAHFRHQDGTPITSRVDGDIPDTNIECTGPSANRTRANVALPSEDILQFREVRGGVRVAELVTPSVLQVVRNQFDCQELTGAELESGEGLPLAMLAEGHGCIGDHWERRLFSTDLMNPVVDESTYTPRISTLTLAYFADSGWYQVDLNYAEVAAGWGRGTGCSFVNDTCIGEHGQVPPENAPFFCNDVPSTESRTFAEEVHGCTPDLSRKAICSIGQYDHALPSEFQYFQDTYGSNVGGIDPFMDYCPVYSGFDNGLCNNVENEQYIKASTIEVFGEKNSRCLVGDMGNNHKMALCLQIACVLEDQTLQISVDGKWHHCEKAGQVIESTSASVVCPDPRRICPTFYCPFDCLGTGGICDYASGECLCEYLSVFEDDWLMAECGSLEATHVDGSNKPANTLILRPTETDDQHPYLPHPDSPLSDYYVPTTRSLHERKAKTSFTLVIVIGVGGAMLIFAAFLAREWSKSQISTVNDTGATPAHRQKDKMVATVLVDMRIHGQEPLNESLAETDERMTDSVASAIPSDALSEISMSRRSETLSDANTSLGDIELPEVDMMHEEMQIIRRRRIGGELS